MIRHTLQLLGPATTIFGVLLGVWGTYLLTRWYHSFGFLDFLRTACRNAWLMLTGREAQAARETKLTTAIAVNAEKRAESLLGIYLIFLGFLLQAIGALCWGADSVWGIFWPENNPSAQHAITISLLETQEGRQVTGSPLGLRYPV